MIKLKTTLITYCIYFVCLQRRKYNNYFNIIYIYNIYCIMMVITIYDEDNLLVMMIILLVESLIIVINVVAIISILLYIKL